LRANTAANGRQAGGGGNDLIRTLKIALSYLGDKLRNADLYRATGNAGHILAVQTAKRLGDGILLAVSGRDLFKIPCA
jgi:hypothetical protein